MKLIKACFSGTVNIIKLANKANLLLNHLCMKRGRNLAIATFTVTVLATSSVVAEESRIAIHNAIACETKAACQQLTDTILSQINELKSKGLRNLSKPKRLEFVKLRKQLIALENQKQEKQRLTIAAEKSETNSQKELLKAIDKTDKQIAGLKGALLEK